MISKNLHLLFLMLLASCTSHADRPTTSSDIQSLTLADYRPVSVYNIPVTHIPKAAFPVIDMHSHDYAENQEEVDRWVETQKKVGIEKTLILSGGYAMLLE